MKTLISAVLAVLLTVTSISPAEAKLSSGDRDKIAIGIGVIAIAEWLFGDSTSNGERIIDLDEDCRRGSWDLSDCRSRNRIAKKWEKNAKKYINYTLDIPKLEQDLFDASALLGEYEVYAQTDDSRQMTQKLRKAKKSVADAKGDLQQVYDKMEELSEKMNENLVDYRKYRGNPDRLKAWAQQYQEQREDFDPTVAPWEQ